MLFFLGIRSRKQNIQDLKKKMLFQNSNYITTFD